jgi:hypothetical protein
MRARTSLRLVGLMGTVFALGGTATAAVIFDSNGFESPDYTIGFLAGQNGFTSNATGGGSAPEVVIGPDSAVAHQAVRLQVPDLQGATSGWELPVADLVAAGYTQVTVSFDIYRQMDAWSSNLWWYWFDNGSPTYGLQWDQGSGTSGTYAFEFNNGVPTVYDQWATLSMTWDFSTGTATATYNGAPAGTTSISGITSLTGWGLYLGHDEGAGSGSEVAWIDNFVITGVPEPATLILLAVGMLALPKRR